MYERMRVKIVNPSSLYMDSYVQRKEYTEEEMNPLVRSIAEHGVVEPIFVKRRNGRNEVISGFKRWTAAKMAGVSKIPVIEIYVWAEIIEKKYTVTVDAEYEVAEIEEVSSIEVECLKIFNHAAMCGQHVIKTSLFFDVGSWIKGSEVCSAIEKFKEKHRNYTLDILFCSDKKIDNYEDSMFWINDCNILSMIYPEKWNGWNGWKPFCRFIYPMQIKKEGKNHARLWDVCEDKEIHIILENGVTFDRFHEALCNFDSSDWLIGLDYLDVKKTLFPADNHNDEVFFFEWSRVTKKTLGDLNSFLYNNNKKMVSMLFWGYKGIIATFDVAEILCIYADCDYVFQYCDGVFDDERETIHALCICEPGVNELDISDTAANSMPVLLTLNGNQPELIEPDFGNEEDLIKKGIICEEKGDYKRAVSYYQKAIDEHESAEAYYRIGVMYYDGNWFVKAEKPKGVRYFEMAYERGFDNFRPGDLLMMGIYRQYEVAEGRKYGLIRNMNLAIRYYKKMIITEVERNMSLLSVEKGYSQLAEAYLEDEVLNYKKAYQNLVKSGCRDEKSKYYMGYLYEFGYYVKQDLKKAKEMFNEALMISHLGDLYYNKAMKELKKIRSANNDGKKILEIENLRKQSHVFRSSRDWEPYVNIQQRIYDLTKDVYPDYEACYNLSSYYWWEAERGERDDCKALFYGKAFFYDNVLAEKGDNEAKLRIVGKYNSGVYDEERELAKQYLKDLEEEDYKPVYIFLGCDYRYGNMLFEKNIEKALTYFEKAGMEGITAGYEFLGEMYYKGSDVPVDYAVAYIYLEQCRGDFEFADSYFILGDLYDRGLGTKQSATRARYNYQRGIEKWNKLYDGKSEEELEKCNIDMRGYKKAKDYLERQNHH